MQKESGNGHTALTHSILLPKEHQSRRDRFLFALQTVLLHSNFEHEFYIVIIENYSLVKDSMDYIIGRHK